MGTEQAFKLQHEQILILHVTQRDYLFDVRSQQNAIKQRKKHLRSKFLASMVHCGSPTDRVQPALHPHSPDAPFQR